MIDCFGYKCERLEEINPALRLTNSYPSLPPEASNTAIKYDWEELFGEIKELYEDGVTLNGIMEALDIVGVDVLRKKIKLWVRRGLIVQRVHPREPNKWKQEHTELLVRRLGEGATATVIAAELNMTRDTILYHMRDSNYTYDPEVKRWVNEESA